MATTLGVHVVSTTYGTWLPGDLRGHWSAFVDAEGHVVYPQHAPLPADAELEHQARLRMKHAAMILADAEQEIVARVFGEVTRQYGYNVLAAAIRSTITSAPSWGATRVSAAKLSAWNAGTGRSGRMGISRCSSKLRKLWLTRSDTSSGIIPNVDCRCGGGIGSGRGKRRRRE